MLLYIFPGKSHFVMFPFLSSSTLFLVTPWLSKCYLCLGYSLSSMSRKLFFKILFYFFEAEREHEQKRGRGKEEWEADSPLTREPDVWLDPSSWDHELSQRQMVNQLSHPGTSGLISYNSFSQGLLKAYLSKFLPYIFSSFL